MKVYVEHSHLNMRSLNCLGIGSCLMRFVCTSILFLVKYVPFSTKKFGKKLYHLLFLLATHQGCDKPPASKQAEIGLIEIHVVCFYLPISRLQSLGTALFSVLIALPNGRLDSTHHHDNDNAFILDLANGGCCSVIQR